MPEDRPAAGAARTLLPHDRGPPLHRVDPEKAVELLDASGWTDSDGDGIRDKDGEKLSLMHCHTGAGFRVAAGDYLASKFRDLGVELINTASPETVFAGWNEASPDACNLTHGNHDTAEFAWVSGFDLFGNTYTVYHSNYIPTEENGGAGASYARLNDPRVDAVLDNAAAPPTSSRRSEYAHQLSSCSPRRSRRSCSTTGATFAALTPTSATTSGPKHRPTSGTSADWYLKDAPPPAGPSPRPRRLGRTLQGRPSRLPSCDRPASRWRSSPSQRNPR
jgi:hypothetical protein